MFLRSGALGVADRARRIRRLLPRCPAASHRAPGGRGHRAASGRASDRSAALQRDRGHGRGRRGCCTRPATPVAAGRSASRGRAGTGLRGVVPCLRSGRGPVGPVVVAPPGPGIHPYGAVRRSGRSRRPAGERGGSRPRRRLHAGVRRGCGSPRRASRRRGGQRRRLPLSSAPQQRCEPASRGCRWLLQAGTCTCPSPSCCSSGSR